MVKHRFGLMLTSLVVLITLVVSVFAVQAGGSLAQSELPVGSQKQLAGSVVPAQSQALRKSNGAYQESLVSAGAKFIRLHFVDFDLSEGAVLTVSSPDGAQKYSYTGKGSNQNGDFWSFAIDGEAVEVNLEGEGKYRIIEVGHGTVDLNASLPTPEIVVGTDGREDIACHTDETVINNTQKPVARLLFTVKKSQYLCTGELVRGSNANTLITNNHCFADQTATSTVEARFNYQYTTCGGSTLSATTSFAGGTFLKTNSVTYNKRKASTTGLDYTLITLQGTPEATFGELIPTSVISVGTQMNFIQHPAGLPKQIGYWEDYEHTVRCKIDTINQTYGTSYPNTQAGYGCDSEGGSSGSAITRASDGKMIALHHYGGVTTTLNSGTMMSFICSNAGSLLICDTN